MELKKQQQKKKLTFSVIKAVGSAGGQFQRLDIYTSETRQMNENIKSTFNFKYLSKTQ